MRKSYQETERQKLLMEDCEYWLFNAKAEAVV